jgi:hypothetical protein
VIRPALTLVLTFRRAAFDFRVLLFLLVDLDLFMSGCAWFWSCPFFPALSRAACQKICNRILAPALEFAAQDFAPLAAHSTRFDTGLHLHAPGFRFCDLIRFGGRLGFVHDRFSLGHDIVTNSDPSLHDLAPIVCDFASSDFGSDFQVPGGSFPTLAVPGG